MTIQIFGGKDTRAIRVYWMLEELGVPYESHSIDFRQGEHRSPEYLAINPAGKVPALKDGETTLFESAAILTYLAEKYEDKGFIPKIGTPQRGEFFQWMFYSMAELEQPLWTNAKHKFALPKDLRVPAVRDTVPFEWKRACKVVAQSLEGKEFLVGNRFTAVDILVGQTLMWGQFTKLDHEKPILDEYVNRLKKREAFQKAKGD